MENIVIVVGCNGNIGKAISEFELNNSPDKVIGIDLQESSNLEEFENFIYLTFNCIKPLVIEEYFEKSFPNNKYSIRSIALTAALDSVPKDISNTSRYDFGLINQQFHEINERVNVNITSQIYMLKIFEKYLNKKSHVCLFSSVYGIQSPDQRIYSDGFIKPLEYSASKSSLICMTKHFAITSALQNKGRCNCLVLGGIGNNSQESDFQKKYINKVPLDRMATIEDVVNAYSFLNSTKSSYITGTQIVVDGGYSAW